MDFTLPDLIDIEKLQVFLDSFQSAVGISAYLTDAKGEEIIAPRMHSLCREFHRKNERTLGSCTQNDSRLTNEIVLGEPSGVYPCRNGLTHAVSAIRIDGRHVANMIFGQFRLPAENSSAPRRPGTVSMKPDIWTP